MNCGVAEIRKIYFYLGAPCRRCVLRSVALPIDSPVRATDCVGRYDGEEFVVALPYMDLADALEFAERAPGSTQYVE